jgi:hypothetical protein
MRGDIPAAEWNAVEMATMSDRSEPSLRVLVEAHAHHLREVAITMSATVEASKLMLPGTKRLIQDWSAVLLSASEELTLAVSDAGPRHGDPAAVAEQVGVLNKLSRGALMGLLFVVSSVGGAVSDEISDVADHLGVSEKVAETIRTAVNGSEALDDATAAAPDGASSALSNLRSRIADALKYHAGDTDFAWGINERRVTVEIEGEDLLFMDQGSMYGFMVPIPEGIETTSDDVINEGYAALDRVRPVPMPADEARLGVEPE